MGSDADLQQLLGRLAALLGPDQAARVAELQRRQATGTFRVLVVGEAKRGKSTMINALLGRPLLPTGVVPLTAVTTTVGYGEPEGATVDYRDGRTAPVPLAELPAFVTEAGNPDNTRGVAGVRVHLPVALLAGGLELVDTPGTGSVHEHNTAHAQQALAGMDAAVFVLTADPPISASELSWLTQVREQAVQVFCVLNKADHLSPDELAQSVAFTRQVLATELGSDVPLWPVSARQALTASRALTAGQAWDDQDAGGLAAGAPAAAGWGAFTDAFTGYLRDRQGADLDRSVAARAVRIARALAEQAAATLAALALSGQELDDRVAEFGRRVQLVEQDRFASAALLTASIGRLQQQTDTGAEALAASSRPGLARDVAAHLDALSGPVAQVETQALAFAGGQIRRLAGQWRTARAGVLQAEVAELDAQGRQRLAAHIDAVRHAASSLFALDLPALPAPARLVGSQRFTYAFAPEVGQTEALAAAVRSRLPGRWGRRQVRRYVLGRAEQLLDRNLGRAQADLRARLAQTQRDLLRESDQQFSDGAGQIARTLQDAVALRTEQAHQRHTAKDRALTLHDAARALYDELQDGAANATAAG